MALQLLVPEEGLRFMTFINYFVYKVHLWELQRIKTLCESRCTGCLTEIPIDEEINKGGDNIKNAIKQAAFDMLG
jgi:hypothetical protein